MPKFFVSLLKAFWGDAAKKENDFAYDYLPKAGEGFQGAGYSWIPLFEAMGAGTIKGMLVWGMNPAVSAPNLNQTYQALDKLEWLAAFDLWETDTSVFWKRPGANPKDIKTEVFLFPVADSLEKEGSASNSGRWLQWRYQAVQPHGDAKSDLWYANRLGLELQKLYKGDPKAAFPEPIVNLNWNYGADPDVHLVAKEVNGYTVADKKQVLNFLGLKDDGSTACGCWIYSGSYPGPDKKNNLMARRDKKDPSGLGTLRQLVLGLAGEPAHHLQPLFRRSPGSALQQGQGPGALGCGGQGLEEPRRAGFQMDQPGHQGPGAPGGIGQGPVSHAAGRQGPPLHPQGTLQRRALPGALRGPGMSLPQPHVAAAVQPGGEDLEIGLVQTRRGLRSPSIPSSPPPSGSPSTGRAGP